MRWTDVIVDDDGLAVLWIRRGISPAADGVMAELDTKTHQQRRVTLDPETLAVLDEHRTRTAKRLANAGYELAEDAFVFSGTADHSRFLTPSAVTQRYERLGRVSKLGAGVMPGVAVSACR